MASCRNEKAKQMQLANVRLRLDKQGSDVPLKDVTPAQALVLHLLHQGNNGGSSYGEDMNKIEITGDALTVEATYESGKPTKTHPRTASEEYKRLFSLYGGLTNKKGDRLLSKVFPDKSNLKMPEKFSDLKWAELSYDGVDVAASDFGTSAGAAITQPKK